MLLTWRHSKLQLASCASAIIAVVLLGYGDRLIERYVSINDASNLGRLSGIFASRDMVLQKPFFGFGFGSSPSFVPMYRDILFQSNSTELEIHTTYLQVAGELGLFGVIAYSILYGLICVRFEQIRRR